MKLSDLTSLIRSKNAGPFSLTFDIFFETEEGYRRVRDGQALTPAVFAGLYACPVSDVRYYTCDGVKAIKISIPQPIFQGELGCSDMHGGQQFAPLMDLEV